MGKQNNLMNSLAHTKWNSKYHIIFALKYKMKVFYKEKRAEVREIIRTLCQWKRIRDNREKYVPIILINIPPKMSIFMRYLKGKSSLMILERLGDMKFAYRN